jgi:cellulose synthase/poly-beta-1,6-N-acetylglucosamine synthase-like glycosyltransferase
MLVSWVLMALLVVLNLALLPYFAFMMTISLASIFGRRKEQGTLKPRSRLAIVIPAHNEATGIAKTVQSCLAADYPRSLFRVIVIADNCTDQTAAIAGEIGATVVERFDPTKKSKGYALEFLFETLSKTGQLDLLDAVVIIDADTTIDRTLLLDFDQELSAGRDWIQCYYTVADPDRTWRTRLINYAFSLYNGVTLVGQNAIGASAGFRGNGMCFSVPGLRRRPWKSYGLVEDMDYSWSIRIAGEYIRFLSSSRVYGAMPTTRSSAAASQRRRWEFGRQEVRTKFIRPLLFSRDLGMWEKVASFLELMIPSLGWLVILYFLVVTLNTCASASPALREQRGLVWLPLAASLFMTAALSVYAVSPFFALKLPWKYAACLVFFPMYLFWKLLVVVQGRPHQWVRTAREPRVSREV